MSAPLTLINTIQLAEFLKIHPKTVYKWRRQGRLPQPIKPWGWPLYDKQEVLDYLKSSPRRKIE